MKMTLSLKMQIIQQVPDDFDDSLLTSMSQEDKDNWKMDAIAEYSQNPNVNILDANIDGVEVVKI